MNATRAVLTAAVLAVTLAGCSPANQAAPAPVGASPRAATTFTMPPAEPAPTPEGATGTGVQVTDPARVLDHGGFGAIRLGMAEEQLKSTGEVEGEPEVADRYCSLYRLKSGAGSVFVQREGGLGVVSITVDENVRTEEGIRIGSTVEEARAKYPTFDDGVNWDSASLGGGASYGFFGSPTITKLLLLKDGGLCHN